MANYRFKTAEIEAMKKNILTHIEREAETKTAWRLRCAIEGQLMCCRPSKREAARLERELALYEKLTKNDLPNWQSEPTQPATLTETPQISTETAEPVNVSAEDEKAAERPQYRVWRFAKPNYAQIIVSDYSQWKVVAVLSFVWGKTQIEVSDDVANIHTIGKKELTIDKPLTELTDAEVLELIYNHTEPPQSPETPQTVECADECDCRICSHCGARFHEGYFLGNEYACSDECAVALYGGDREQFEADLEAEEEEAGTTECYWSIW